MNRAPSSHRAGRHHRHRGHDRARGHRQLVRLAGQGAGAARSADRGGGPAAGRRGDRGRASLRPARAPSRSHRRRRRRRPTTRSAPARRTPHSSSASDGPKLHIATAASPTVAALLTQASREFGAGQPVPIVDVVPAGPDDPRGAGFAAGFLPLLLAAMVAGIILAVRIPTWEARILGVIAFAVLAGLVGAAVLDWLGLTDGQLPGRGRRHRPGRTRHQPLRSLAWRPFSDPPGIALGVRASSSCSATPSQGWPRRRNCCPNPGAR